MPKPLKVRRANEIVGVFVLSAVLIAIAVVLFGPTTRRWFTPSQTLAIQLPPEGSLGLREGGDVQVLGSVVGSVESIRLTNDGEMEAFVSIRGDFMRFVRVDSQAIIRKPFGIGETSIDITRGRGAALPARGAVLRSVADQGPAEFVEETLAALRDQAVPALKELRGAISQYALLATELSAEQGNTQQALRHLNDLSASLQKGQGVAGMLLTDPRPAAELRDALSKVNASLAELQPLLGHARTLSADADRLTRQTADVLPGVLSQTQESLRQLTRLSEALQRNWLIRGHTQPEGGTRLGSESVGTDQ